MDNITRKKDVGAPGNPGQFAAPTNSAPTATLERPPLNGGARPDAQDIGRGTLNDLMQFDHVIIVREGGICYDAPHELWGPRAYNPDVHATELEGWTLLSGYSGQHGYRGPWMHDSEVIAGKIAEDVLDKPGYYVAIYATYDDVDNLEDGDTIDEGWAIAFKPLD